MSKWELSIKVSTHTHVQRQLRKNNFFIHQLIIYWTKSKELSWVKRTVDEKLV